jgi:hypothetical protein
MQQVEAARAMRQACAGGDGGDDEGIVDKFHSFYYTYFLILSFIVLILAP